METLTFNWDDIVAVYLAQPWWVWVTQIILAWLGVRWLIQAGRAYAERPSFNDNEFRQRRVRVDYRAGTIPLPRGDVFAVSRVRGLRWEDYPRGGFYTAFIDIDDMKRPIHPVLFSASQRPERFVSRLRTAIEKAGGPRFAIRGSERIDIVERDLRDPFAAATATRVTGHGQKTYFSRVD